MPTPPATEINDLARAHDLVPRILAGEVVVARGVLQRAGLFDELVAASVKGIGVSGGADVAAKAARDGFDRVHEWVTPGDIPALTDGVYAVLSPMACELLTTLVPALFPLAGTYYYERSPNVRFHIPFDLAARHRREFDKFAEKRGQGKIAAHGPHRDPWVDCPANAINIWIAVGPVQRGNGMTVYADDYQTDFRFKDGYVEDGAPLHKPLTFDLAPGDAVLFHSNHLHGSELNRTDRTRYVVSFRITFGKPRYPHGHYHHYLHGGMAAGPLRSLAAIPQNLQASFFRYQLQRLRYKVTGRGRMTGADSAGSSAPARAAAPLVTRSSIPLAELPVGAILAVSKTVCVARLGEHDIVAVGRRCPHSGGDLAAGWIDDGKIVCPLHALPIDGRTGQSACASLPPLRRFACEVLGDRVHVSTSPVPSPTNVTPTTANELYQEV